MPDVQTNVGPSAFHASLPLTLAEQDLIGWYFFPQASSLPTAQIPAPAYIGSPDRAQCGICQPGQLAIWRVSR
jgi:hypothetical protein